MKKFDYIAYFLHGLIVMAVYRIYVSYPPNEVPIPHFNYLTSGAGIAYGIAGILTLREYLKRLEQSYFNMAVVLIAAGGLLFISAGLMRPAPVIDAAPHVVDTRPGPTAE